MNTVADNSSTEPGESDSIAISQALYLCCCGEDGEKDLQLVTSGLTSDREHQLRQFLLRRLRKGAVYEGTGSCSGLDFSIGEGSSTPGVCFYILLPCSELRKKVDLSKEKDENQSRTALICLLSDSETTLETFQVELTQFCESIAHRIPENGPPPTSIDEELKEWYGACVLYTVRVVRALGPEGLSCLLHVARQDQTIEMSPEVDSQLCEDVRRLASGCGVARLLGGKRISYTEGDHNRGITFERTPLGPYPLSPKIPQGCRISARLIEWGRRLAATGSSGVSEHNRACRIKRALEAFRLETIKDMNVLKRLLKQSETDHYCLYRACIFLRQSGNSTALLEHAKMEGGSSIDVITVLEDYFSKFSNLGGQKAEGAFG